MACRGVHFALTSEQASRVTSGLGREELLNLVEEFESGPSGEGWDKEWIQETDKAWDAIHRCLTDGKLEWGQAACHKCILGTGSLYDGDDYIMNYLSPDEVREVAATIRDIGRDELLRRYNKIDRASYVQFSDEDFEYTWSWFEELREFFQKAVAANRAMLFTADQ